MMKHAWDAYEKYAWQTDALAPMAKKGINWSHLPIGVTILDSLDTLYLMGLEKEFELALIFVQQNLTFRRPIEVDLLQMTTHCLGGLISAYELTNEDVFKQRARELGDRLMPAFETKSGAPNRILDMKSGNSFTPSDQDEFMYLQLEFLRLSEITRNVRYAKTVYMSLKLYDVLS